MNSKYLNVNKCTFKKQYPLPGKKSENYERRLYGNMKVDGQEQLQKHNQKLEKK